MTYKEQQLPLFLWMVVKNGFLVFLSCLLLDAGILIPAILIYVFMFIDLGIEFMRMVETL